MLGKWTTNKSTEHSSLPYVVVLMISRNKDNKDVENFKERKTSKFCSYRKDKIDKEFEFFVNNGVNGEMSRLYVSLNGRNTDKIKKEFLHYIIDKDNLNFDYIEPTLAGIAAKKENALEKKWFFDFDSKNLNDLKRFMQEIKCRDNSLNPISVPTPNGYAVIIEHGFDTRELLSDWGDICSLKRDDLICVNWKRNANNR